MLFTLMKIDDLEQIARLQWLAFVLNISHRRRIAIFPFAVRERKRERERKKETSLDCADGGCSARYRLSAFAYGRAVEIACRICVISLRTSKEFQITCPGTKAS